MPKYKNDDENKYFPAMITILIVIAVAISTFVISILPDSKEEVGEDIGIEKVDPVDAVFPTSEPSVAPPTAPPVSP